jgi:K+/H+ antiporter YhaU regulatory subunit KhtT
MALVGLNVRGGQAAAVAETLFANLLRDTQRIHCRSIRVAKRVQSNRRSTNFSPSCFVNGSIFPNVLRKKLGIIIVAMKKKDGAMGFDPAAESRIESGDCLIALGTAESLRKLEEMAG